MQDLLGGSGKTRLRLLVTKTQTQYISKHKSITSCVFVFKDNIYSGFQDESSCCVTQQPWLNTIVAAVSLLLVDGKTRGIHSLYFVREKNPGAEQLICLFWPYDGRCTCLLRPAGETQPEWSWMCTARFVCSFTVRPYKATVIPFLGRNK